MGGNNQIWSVNWCDGDDKRREAEEAFPRFFGGAERGPGSRSGCQNGFPLEKLLQSTVILGSQSSRGTESKASLAALEVGVPNGCV